MARSKAPLIIGGLVLLLGFGFAATAGASPATPPAPKPPKPPRPAPPPIVPPAPPPAPPPVIPPDDFNFDDITDDELQPEACALVGQSIAPDRDVAVQLLGSLFPSVDWLAVPVTSPAAALLSRATLLVGRIRSGEVICDDTIVIEDTPRAGGYYQIRKGDTPLGIIKKAYPSLSAAERIEAVRLVTASARNGGNISGQGIVIDSRLKSTKDLIGPVIFSMYTDWRCKPSTVSERFIPGNCYAVLFLPILEGEL